jgi:GNAT superfamily N-acetyltransferase
MAAIGEGIGALIAGHIDLAFRTLLSGPGVEMHPRFTRLITGEAHPFGNFAMVKVPADAAVVEAAIEPLIRCGAPSAMLFTGDVSPAIVARLGDAGFLPHGGMPAMGVDIDRVKPTTLPPGYTLERVHASEEDAWGEAFARGYELPMPVGMCFGGGFDPRSPGAQSTGYYAIRREGAIVATSAVFLAAGVAGIYAVSTVPEERGKGLGAHATAEPLRMARERGYRVGVLQASEAGHPVYVRLGFSEFGAVPIFVRMP